MTPGAEGVGSPGEPVAFESGPRAPLLPRRAPRRDHVLPILIALSVVVHATAILPSLLRTDDAPHAFKPQEIPVELVQEPPPPKPPQKPELAAKVAAPRPAPAPAAQQKATKEKPSPKPQQDAKPQHAQRPPETKPRQQPREPRRQDEADQSVAERLRRLLGTPPPGMDATPLPGASADGSIDVTYTQLVLSQVAKAKKEGKFHGMPGAASVSFVVGDSGELTSVEIVRPSGDASLDAEAVAMIRRAAPFPAPPPGGRRDYTVTLMFKPIS